MRTNVETRKGRILKIEVKTVTDDSPDTSYLGEYQSQPGPDDRTIDRQERGDMGRNECRYFVAAMSGEATGNPASVEQDYRRMELLGAGEWYYVGIIAKATVTLPGGDIVQTITSGGLWGIESDSSPEYLAEVEAEQLAELRRELEAVGFGRRAIERAMADCKHV